MSCPEEPPASTQDQPAPPSFLGQGAGGRWARSTHTQARQQSLPEPCPCLSLVHCDAGWVVREEGGVGAEAGVGPLGTSEGHTWECVLALTDSSVSILRAGSQAASRTAMVTGEPSLPGLQASAGACSPCPPFHTWHPQLCCSWDFSAAVGQEGPCGVPHCGSPLEGSV